MEDTKRPVDIGEWDQQFIAVDQEMLFEIILAANYLDIKALLCAASCSVTIEFLTPLVATSGARSSLT